MSLTANRAARLFWIALVLILVPAFAIAAEEPVKKKKGPPVDANGRPYVHVCAAGTEPVGVAGKQMWCRQPVSGGFRRQGTFVEWYANGKKRSAGEFQSDLKTGTWTRYYPNGKKREEIEYYNGKEIRKTKYDRRGKVLDTSARDQRIAASKAQAKLLREAHSWKKPRDSRR